MRTREIFEYVSDDVTAHEKARAAFHRLSRYVYDGGKPDFELEIQTPDGNEDYYGLKPETIDLGFDDVCVLIGLRNKKSVVMAGGMWRLPPEHAIDGKYRKALVVHSMREFNLNEFKTSVNSTAFVETFGHEYIHLLDYARTNDRIGAGPKLDPHDRSKYYNDPAEFNAYYQMFLSPWLGLLKDIQENPKDAKDLMDIFSFTGSFRDDTKQIITASFHQRQFFENLTDRNRKRLMQRMYQLHKAILDATHEPNTSRDRRAYPPA